MQTRHLPLSETICCIAGSTGRPLIATTGCSTVFVLNFTSVESELIKSSRHSAEQFSPSATWTEARSDSDETVSTSLILPRSKMASETCSRNWETSLLGICSDDESGRDSRLSPQSRAMASKTPAAMGKDL